MEFKALGVRGLAIGFMVRGFKSKGFRLRRLEVSWGYRV